LQALRSHDDRFDAMVNKLDLIGKDTSKMEVIAITDKIQKKPETPKDAKNKGTGTGGFTIGEPVKRPSKDDQGELQFEIGEIERAIYAKLVQKVGNRHHWEDWANDIAKIARTHIDRISGILENTENTTEREAFLAFAAELRDDLNDSITDGEIIEMLAQHLITKPVFDALFEGYSFAQHNPMSQAMQAVLDVLQEHQLNEEADTLQSFYDSVKMRAEGIDSAAGKQKIIVELYNNFFAKAFPRLRDKLGIVYTPVEVVDFIIQSVDHILKTEFNQTLGSKGVHIIDPFTGTGTFITRLMQSGLIAPEQLAYKYKNEVHANEIVLLAYYIAAINIEAVYHSIVGGNYQPFDGICLTDTFQMYEKEDMVDALLEKNSARRKRQKKLDIRVIIGNPPYSSGQDNANENNQKVSYHFLDERIKGTYAGQSSATLTSSLYNSYIRAIRWASDRIGNSGVIGFVSGSGFVEKPAMDGIRKCLNDEFSSIYVLNLRGDINKGMLNRYAKEGGNIFGSASKSGIAVTLFVKNSDVKQGCRIYYHDIGDDLSCDEKLGRVSDFVSISGIAESNCWQAISPDSHHDWINQRDDSFSDFIMLGCKGAEISETLFFDYSGGVKTQRDAWCYNAARAEVIANMSRMIRFYNSEVARFSEAFSGLDKKTRETKIDNFINNDSTKISWSVYLKDALIRDQCLVFDEMNLRHCLYRPFTKQWLYFNRQLNERVLQMPRVFPETTTKNLIICINGKGSRNGNSAIISDLIVDLNALEAGTQCFPLYLFDESAESVEQGDLFASADKPKRKQRDAITDEGLANFQSAYHGEQISKEDVFYYVYGLLYSPDYRERYADNLSKELPRIPRVKTAADFWAFSQAGRKLADLHLNYETVAAYPIKIEAAEKLTDTDYRVEKMKYGKKGKDKDLTTLHYNNKITLTGIPLEAYEYIVNGKPALDWVVERQCVKTDKDSGIVNDANDWAIETMNNPRYPLELFQRVITVSLETMKIVKALPKLDI
jgi:predicted helicase